MQRNEGNILLIGDFKARIITNQSIILSNDSNSKPIWINEHLVLASRYKRNYEDLVDNLFSIELINRCSSQDLIICNVLMK